MKTFITKSMAIALGVSMVAPALFAGPTSVNGSLGGFSANAQGGQNPGDWGIPEGNGQNHGGQNNKGADAGGYGGDTQGKGPDAGGYGGNGQNGASPAQGKGPDAGGYGGNGQNGASPAQGKGPDAGGYGGDGQNSQTGNGQNGPAEQQGKPADSGGLNDGSSAPDEGPTKNHSNNSESGSAEGEGPTKNHNNSGGDDGAQGENGSSGGSSSGSGSGSGSSSGSGSGSGSDFPPLDPSSDGQYDPANNEGDQQIPSGCAEAGSACAQCVQHNENVVQFNRRYLHVAWSVTHQTIEYTKQMIAFGDSVSGIHQTQALAWQLAGKPQITEAVASLRKTYDNKYRIYINNMEQALHAMNECEQDNFAVRDLYQRFSALYLEFVKARYQSPD